MLNKTNSIPYKNILKLLDFSFASPASNAPIESFFLLYLTIFGFPKNPKWD